MTSTQDFDSFWAELNQELFKPLHPYLTGLMYRGLPDKSYELKTSLQRLNVTKQRNNNSWLLSSFKESPEGW